LSISGLKLNIGVTLEEMKDYKCSFAYLITAERSDGLGTLARSRPEREKERKIVCAGERERERERERKIVCEGEREKK
jgi:hypothetical protein